MGIIENKIKEIYSNEVINKKSAVQLKKKLNLPMYIIENILIHNSDYKDQNSEKILNSIQNKLVKTKNNSKTQDKIRQKGSLTIIDKVKVKPITNQDKYFAQLINLSVKKAKISKKLVKNYPQLLELGLWAEIKINYLGDHSNTNSEFEIKNLIPYEKREIEFNKFKNKAKKFTKLQWRYLLLRSLGIEPSNLSKRQQLLFLSRLIPLVEQNYNFIELGLRGTGKSYLYRQLFNQSILVSGGQTTAANLFYNMNTKRVGLIGKWDVIAFDEVAYIDFKDKTTIQILKDYMESGSFSRGKEEINADASMVFLGNINQSIRSLLHNNNLFQPLPELMQDLALIDRFHFYLPGWDLKKLKEEDITNHYGLQSNYLALALDELRKSNFTAAIDNQFSLDPQMDIRDKVAIKKTVAGYLKLLHPSGKFDQQDIKSYLDLAIEGRKRIKNELAKIGSFEYQNISFEYTYHNSDDKYYPSLPEQKLKRNFKRKLAAPGTAYIGQVFAEKFALLKIKISIEPGNGELVFVNQNLHQRLKQEIRKTFLFIKQGNTNLKLDTELLNYDFLIEVDIIKNKVKADISSPVLLAIYSALKNKSIPHGLLVTNESSLYYNPTNNYKLEAVKIKDPQQRTRTLIPLKNETYVEVPAKIIEKAPVFIEI